MPGQVSPREGGRAEGQQSGPPGGKALHPGCSCLRTAGFPPHRWETRALAPCPVTCGGGQVPLAVRCVRVDRGRLVSLPHSKCWPVPRPRPLEDCSPEPCPARSASLRRQVVLGRRLCRVASSCPKPWRPHPQERVILVQRRQGRGVWNALGTCGWWLVFHHLLFTGLLCPGAVLSQVDPAANKAVRRPWAHGADAGGWGRGDG